MARSKAPRTKIHIDHPSVGADGRATSYLGRVSVRGKTVAQTAVMTDGRACLRAVEALERQVQAGFGTGVPSEHSKACL